MMSHRALAALAAVAAVTACSPGLAGTREDPARSATGDPAKPTPGIVDVKTARTLLEAGARVVDVRTPAEFADGHVPGAVNIPFDQIGKRASEIGPPETPVVLYCRSGRRSGIAAETLRGLGYGKLYDMQRYDAWAASEQGHPLHPRESTQ